MAFSGKVEGVTLPKIPALPDKTVALVILGLLVFGVVMVYDASSAQALASFNDKYFFLKEQIKWIILGIAAATGGFLFDYRKLKPFAFPGLIFSIVLLLAVFLPGVGVGAYGAHRWINLGFTVVQPSEIAKLALIVYLAVWLSAKGKASMGAFLLLIGLVGGLIMLEPDMGTTLVVVGAAVSIYFLSDNPIKSLLFVVPAGLLAAVLLAIQSPYRLKRITSFLDPNSDPLGASYHVRQALIAIGSGGILGIGLGNSRQKYSYLPEANTDSIFAIIGEEMGFIGCLGLIIVFLFLYQRMARITLKVEDPFGRLLGMGIICYLVIQTAINIGSMVAITPLTGVPLPFISYGGSALIIEMLSIGILFNIWKVNLK